MVQKLAKVGGKFGMEFGGMLGLACVSVPVKLCFLSIQSM